MHLLHILQCSIQKSNMHIYVLNWVLWYIEQVHSGISEISVSYYMNNGSNRPSLVETLGVAQHQYIQYTQQFSGERYCISIRLGTKHLPSPWFREAYEEHLIFWTTVCFVCVVVLGGGGGGGGGVGYSISREIYPGFCFALFRCGNIHQCIYVANLPVSYPACLFANTEAFIWFGCPRFKWKKDLG